MQLKDQNAKNGGKPYEVAAVSAGSHATPRSFNLRLRALRSSKGLTQETCAPLLGISKRCLEEWERGGTVPTKAAQEGAVMILKKEKKRDSKRKETQ